MSETPLSKERGKLLRRLYRRKTREREGLVVVDGVRAAMDALELGARGRFLVRSPRSESTWSAGLDALVAEAGLEVVHVSDAEMAELSHTTAPQGVLLVAEQPRVDAEAVWGGDSPRLLLLDGVQEPGNVGSLLRTAAAFDCTGVVALDGTADLWGARALRAASGLTFALPTLQMPWSEAEVELSRRGIPLFVADAEGSPAASVAAGSGWALAMGSEATGCRSEVMERSHARIAIPMSSRVDSLNVGIAGAILLYELTRETRS